MKEDIFINSAHSILKKAEDHKNLIISILIGFVVAASGYSFFQHNTEKKEIEAQEALFKAEKTNTAQTYQKIIESHPNSQASILAALKLSDLYLKENKMDKATEVLSKAQQKLTSEEVLYGLVTMKLSSVFELNNQCQKSIDTLKSISKSKEFKYLKGEALLKMGLCYEKLGDQQQAIISYEQAKQQFPDTATGKQAQKYLTLLKLNKG